LTRARIRGVYSTALTKLLLDHGFDIVCPSAAARERFGIEQRNEPPDLDIRERPDRQGVCAVGSAESLATFKAILQSRLHDVIIRKTAGEAVTLVDPRDDSHFLDAEFPAMSKAELDALRRSVTETVEGHHFYKACGGNLSMAVDMAERLLTMGGAIEEVERLFQETALVGFPTVGSMIGIEHVKLDGRVLRLGEALIEAFDDDAGLIEFSRIVKGKGTYDALGTRRAPGDRAITRAKIGAWHYNTQYFSKDGRHEGTYINFNTPIELYPQGLRYVDLEVDIFVLPGGQVGKVDEEKLEAAATQGVVTQRLVETVKDEAQQLMRAT